MHISDLELFLIELPASGGALRSLLARVTSDRSREGWGETRVAWRAGELAARRKALLSVLAGREVHDVETILALEALSNRAVACAIEMALLDLVARSAGQPLAHLLGGSYRRNVPLSVRLPPGPPEAVVSWSRNFSAQGVQSQVISSTGNVAADLRLTAALAEACGDRARFRFDGRSKFDFPTALQLAAEMDPGWVQFLVDPLAGARADRIAVLAGESRVPLGVYDGVERPADVVRLARMGAAALVVVDPVQVGGISRARQCAIVAEAASLAAGLRIEGTSGLALAATLQLAAATPSFTGGHECSYPVLHDDILVEPLRTVDGMLNVPTGPGLGVEVDRDKIDWYHVSG